MNICLKQLSRVSLLALGLALGWNGPVRAQPANSSNRLDYSSFKLINDRNIFNPRRYARSSSSSERREVRRSSRVESFTLLGTMSYEKGRFAFFDGTRSDYHKVLKPADTIAGYSLSSISPNSVKLSAGTNQVQLKVGMQLKREDEGPWQVAMAPEPAPYTPPPSSYSRSPMPAPVSSVLAQASPNQDTNGVAPQIIVVDANGQTLTGEPPADAGTNAVPDSAAGADDVLRRLMQRREQEMNR